MSADQDRLDAAIAALPDLTFTRPAVVDEASWESAQQFDERQELLDDAAAHWQSWTIGTRHADDTVRRDRYFAACLRAGHVLDLSNGIV